MHSLKLKAQPSLNCFGSNVTNDSSQYYNPTTCKQLAVFQKCYN